jgi:hypothetical protein
LLAAAIKLVNGVDGLWAGDQLLWGLNNPSLPHCSKALVVFYIGHFNAFFLFDLILWLNSSFTEQHWREAEWEAWEA